MSIVEEHIWNGQHLVVSWHDASFLPPRSLTSQASGVCFTDNGLVVLVTADGRHWDLPGGHTEEGETIEETVVREVLEEACASVTSLDYLGAQEVRQMGDTAGSTVYYQARFWARVRLARFRSDYETKGRKLVAPSEINLSLRWNPFGILEAIIEAALVSEKRHAVNRRNGA